VYKIVHFVQNLHLFQSDIAVYFGSRLKSLTTWAQAIEVINNPMPWNLLIGSPTLSNMQST
jgi:hypothetical protein